jgi:putative transposase
MPRGPRVLIRNACYHIVNRGNQKQRIFLEEIDYEEYLKIIKHYKYSFGFKIFGYCLMPNHVHLVIQPKEPEELAAIMQRLTQVYTLWFNEKYKKVGHLWQGRFKNMVINRDEYFIDCICYVEANPVRAGIVNSPREYSWSSYNSRVFGIKDSILDIPDST